MAAICHDYFRLLPRAAAIVLAAAATPAQAGDVITWKGCGISKKAFMEDIAHAYEAKTGIRIELTSAGATDGIRAVSDHKSDLGGTCRHSLKDGKDGLIPEEANAVLTQVAWDAIVPVTHPETPVGNISLDNLKKVFDGTITNWKQLGGPARPMQIVLRSTDRISGVGYMFRLMAFQDPNYEFKVKAAEAKASGALEEQIENIPWSFGITGVSSARKSKVKIMLVDGVVPNKESIASGRYPLFRPLYVTMHKDANADSRSVVEFMLGAEGQQIISRAGTVNLKEGERLAPLWEKIEAKFRTLP